MMKTTRFCLTLALMASLPLMACKKEEAKEVAKTEAPAAVSEAEAPQAAGPQVAQAVLGAAPTPGDVTSPPPASPVYSGEALAKRGGYITVDEAQSWLADPALIEQMKAARTPEEIKAVQDEYKRRMQAMAEGKIPFRSAGGEVGADPEDWVGHWKGAVEGHYMELSINKDATFTVTLVGKDSQHSAKGGFLQDQIVFEGPGHQTDIIRGASGDDTGVAAFAGKSDCVIISRRDAYCRD